MSMLLFNSSSNRIQDLICRQLTLQGGGHIDGFHPSSVGKYHNLEPMGAARLSSGTTPSPNGSFTYRAVKETDNLTYCLKRIPSCIEILLQSDIDGIFSIASLDTKATACLRKLEGWSEVAPPFPPNQ